MSETESVFKDEDIKQPDSDLSSSRYRDKRGRGENNKTIASPRKRRHLSDRTSPGGKSSNSNENPNLSPLKNALNEKIVASNMVSDSGLNNAPCFVRTSVSLSQLFSSTGGQFQSLDRQSFQHVQGIQGNPQVFSSSVQTRQFSTNSIPFSSLQAKQEEEYEVWKEEPREFHDPAITDRLRLPREWEYTDCGVEHEKRPLAGMEMSVMSYNVLAQRLLEDHSFLYEGMRRESLQWQFRRELLLHEFQSHNSDVMCLQEVQENHFANFFLPRLRNLGYDGVYQKRTGDKCDGCAVFYKMDKFSLLKTVPVEYCRGGLMDRDNVAIIVELKPLPNVYSGAVDKICVANTHLLFNPRRGDIKLGQLMILLAELDKCAHSGAPGASALNYSPVILCGDFNSEPQSDLYKFIARGYLNYTGLNARFLSGQEESKYGRDNFLRQGFFCKSFGITDQCQYANLFQERNPKDRSPSSSPSISTVGEDSPLSKECSLSEAEDNRDKSVPSSRDTSPTKNCLSNKDLPSTSTEVSSLSNRDAASPSKEVSPVRDMSHLNHRDRGRPPHLSPLGSSYGFSTSPADFQLSTVGTGKLWHQLNLVSSYKHTIARLNHQHQEVTTQHNAGSCSVDFIFYNVLHKEVKTRNRRLQTRNVREGKLRLLRRYGLMSQREIARLGGLPNPLCPSDHVPLVSTFLLQH